MRWTASVLRPAPRVQGARGPDSTNRTVREWRVASMRQSRANGKKRTLQSVSTSYPTGNGIGSPGRCLVWGWGKRAAVAREKKRKKAGALWARFWRGPPALGRRPARRRVVERTPERELRVCHASLPPPRLAAAETPHRPPPRARLPRRGHLLRRGRHHGGLRAGVQYLLPPQAADPRAQGRGCRHRVA